MATKGPKTKVYPINAYGDTVISDSSSSLTSYSGSSSPHTLSRSSYSDSMSDFGSDNLSIFSKTSTNITPPATRLLRHMAFYDEEKYITNDKKFKRLKKVIYSIIGIILVSMLFSSFFIATIGSFYYSVNRHRPYYEITMDYVLTNFEGMYEEADRISSFLSVVAQKSIEKNVLKNLGSFDNDEFLDDFGSFLEVFLPLMNVSNALSVAFIHEEEYLQYENTSNIWFQINGSGDSSFPIEYSKKFNSDNGSTYINDDGASTGFFHLFQDYDDGLCDDGECHSIVFLDSGDDTPKLRTIRSVFLSRESYTRLGYILVDLGYPQRLKKMLEDVKNTYRFFLLLNYQMNYLVNTHDVTKQWNIDENLEDDFGEAFLVALKGVEQGRKHYLINHRLPFGAALFSKRLTSACERETLVVLLGDSYARFFFRGMWVFLLSVLISCVTVLGMIFLVSLIEKAFVKKTVNRLKAAHASLILQKSSIDNLMKTLLPAKIIPRMLRGENHIVQENLLCISFSDVVGFTELSRKINRYNLLKTLEKLFYQIDLILERYEIFKVKSIGDCVMATIGVNKKYNSRKVLTSTMIRACLEILLLRTSGLKMRSGLNTGNTLCGVIERKSARFDLFGETVNLASRMESTGRAGYVHFPQELVRKVEKNLLANLTVKECEIDIKGYEGKFQTVLCCEKSDFSDDEEEYGQRLVYKRLITRQ